MVPQPTQVNPLHPLPQLQMGHHQGLPLPPPHPLPRPLLLFHARVHRQAHYGRLRVL